MGIFQVLVKYVHQSGPKHHQMHLIFSERLNESLQIPKIDQGFKKLSNIMHNFYEIFYFQHRIFKTENLLNPRKQLVMIQNYLKGSTEHLDQYLHTKILEYYNVSVKHLKKYYYHYNFQSSQEIYLISNNIFLTEQKSIK